MIIESMYLEKYYNYIFEIHVHSDDTKNENYTHTFY